MPRSNQYTTYSGFYRKRLARACNTAIDKSSLKADLKTVEYAPCILRARRRYRENMMAQVIAPKAIASKTTVTQVISKKEI